MKISQEDIDNAVRLWRASVPKEYQNLLQAQPPTNNADFEKLIIAGLLIFTAGQYFNPITGGFIPFLIVRNALEDVINTTGASMDMSTQKLIDGKITRDEWQQEMQKDILSLIIVSSLVAQGGVNSMSPADWVALGLRVDIQYKFLSGFVGDIASGAVALGSNLISRADLYAEAGRAAFEEARTLVNTRDGWTEERRILEPGATHCQGCVDQADEDWQPIGTLDPIGAEECGNNCKCTKQYRKMIDGRWVESEEE